MLKHRWEKSHAETGVIRETGGKTVIDRREKYRVDHFVHSPWLHTLLTRRFRATINFRGGWFEDFRVGKYGKGGHFRKHRDDTTGVSYRKWALVCLLSDPADYAGGILVFPEVKVSLKPVAGTALLFSAHLLHGLTPVTRGRRFALISFACT